MRCDEDIVLDSVPFSLGALALLRGVDRFLIGPPRTLVSAILACVVGAVSVSTARSGIGAYQLG